MADSDRYADRGPTIDAVQITLVVVTVVAVGARFLGRHLAGAGFWWDDWAILAALPLSLACNVANLIAVHNGLGKHVSATPNAATRYLHNLFADELIYNTSLAVIKLGVLLMYYRVFGVSRNFMLALQLVAVTVLMWWIGTEFAIIFQCTPVRKAWQSDLPGSCIDIEAFFLGQAIPNIIQDIVLLLLPQQQVWRLDLSWQKKLALAGIFLCGAFTAASSLIRLNVIIHLTEQDITWNYFGASVWSAVEPAVGIVSACLPCLSPLIRPCCCVYGRRNRTERLPSDPSCRSCHKQQSRTQASDQTEPF